ncbi:MAG: leucyl aminopeptidase [Nitrososphaerota archaeon]|nr:leucyl aminopeptidase [Aigarchaeota archaeon]MDW8076783.1 leucyl aminopeptidase [Nitrososphaerota archaeon]
MMKFEVVSTNLEDVDTDSVVIQLFEGPEIVVTLPDSIRREIAPSIEAGGFKAKLGQVLPIYTKSTGPVRCFLLLGLGNRQDFSLEAVRQAHGYAALKAKEIGVRSVAVPIPNLPPYTPSEITTSVVEAISLALYRFDRYKSKVEEGKYPELVRLVVDSNVKDACDAAAREAVIVSESVKLARDIANTPSNYIPPKKMAEIATEIGMVSGFSTKVFEMEVLERMGMNGIVSVGKGSSNPPVLIVMKYDGGGDTYVFVGKGVVFDSGGISIKPSEKMEEMKYDKSGAAAVIALMKAVAELKLPVRLIGIVPVVENLPSGNALKPGDIIKFRNGKTAEIINTDAEGRLILADALAYASEMKPKAIVDLATLTGACVIALGTHASGLLSNNDKLAEALLKAGEKTGERLWRLPLWKEYFEQIKSEVADMKNVGGRPAGAITAAAFLMNFVDSNIPWAHIDIAGTAWTQESSPEKSYIPKGATGIGVRLLIEFLKSEIKRG